MLATGRTILRLRTQQEVSEKTSYTLLRTTGIFFLFSGILMVIGEQGVRHIALSGANYYSDAFNVAGSTTFMLGIFNLILASKTNSNTNRSLTFVVLLANGIAFLCGTFWVTNVAQLFQRSCWGNPSCIYSIEYDFPTRWIQDHGAENAIPFGSIATFDFLRTMPVYVTIFLSGCVALALLYAMIKIGMTEAKSSRKIAKKVPKKNYTTAIIGVAIILVSFFAIKCLCDANSFLYLRRMHEISLTAPLLTPLGLFGIATLNGRTPSWFRAILMAAAATSFISTYSTLDSVSSFQEKAIMSFESVMDSNCTDVPNDSHGYDYPAPPPPAGSDLEVSSTTEAIHRGKGEACFQLKDGWKKAGIVCIDKDKICDGTVDIVDPVEVCRTIPNHYMYTSESGAHFIDEIFCPNNGINGVASTFRAVNWLNMLLSLAMVVALAFTFKDDENDDQKSVEEKERMAFLHVWDKFHGTLFSKVSNEEIPTGQDETPIIKKKLDSPC